MALQFLNNGYFAGKVGIGTASPAEKLEVSGGHIKITNAGNTNLYINANASNADATIFFEESDSVKAKIQHDASNDSMLFTDGAYTDTMTLKGGKVGIGTTNPAEKLEVSGSVKIGNLKIQNANSGRIGFNRNTATGAIYDSNSSAFQINGSSSSIDYLSFEAYNSSGNFTHQMVYTNSTGRLGIGTTSPAAKLDVKGTDALFITRTSGGLATYIENDGGYPFMAMYQIGGNAKVLINTNGNSYFNGGNVGIGTGSPNALLNLSQAAGANIRFDNETTNKYFTIGEGVGTNNVFSFRGNSYRSTDTMSIDFVNDRVGIGTISPEAKLDISSVAGATYALEISTPERNRALFYYNSASASDAGYLGIKRGSVDALNHRFATTGNSAVCIGEGNFGIGLTGPTAKLHVFEPTANTGVTLKVQSYSWDATLSLINDQGTWEILNDRTGLGTNGTLAFYNGGYRMAITPAGNVGIGTTSPGRILHLDADQGRPIIQLDKGGDKIISMGTGSSATGADDTIFQMFNEGSELVRIFTEGNSWLNGGNVGIGTTTPHAFDTTATKFHVKNDAGAGNVAEVARFEGSSDATGSGAVVRIGTSNDRGMYFQAGRTGSVPYAEIGTTEYNGAKTLAIALDNAGNVGIGTTTPGAKLDINSPSFWINPADGSHAGLHFRQADAFKGFVGYNDSTNVVNLSMDGSIVNGINVNSSHNVGIGTATPQGKLDVASSGADGLILSYDRGAAGNSNRLMFTTSTQGQGWAINNQSAKLHFSYGAHPISNSGSSKIVMDANGRFGIGLTSPSYKLSVDTDFNDGIYLKCAGTGDAEWLFSANGVNNFYLKDINQNAERLRINSSGYLGVLESNPQYELDVDGDIHASGDVIAFSDISLKENIKTIDNSLEKVNKLRGVEFNKIGEDKKSIGVIAQEIEKILPEVVKENSEGIKSVAYGNITGILIEAIKELKQEIETLKTQINK